MRLAKILSGGQTGIDRGALDAALAWGFPCSGWCPPGRLAEDGRIPEGTVKLSERHEKGGHGSGEILSK
jgi:Circularly permutated YpsA SLOG family